MAVRYGIVAGTAAVLLAVSGASASVVSRDVALTNDTGVNWSRVVFYLLPPTPITNLVLFTPIRFVDTTALQSTTIPQATVNFPDSPKNDVVQFTFDPNLSFLGNGQSVTFTLTVDDPNNYGFRIGVRTFDAPQPPVPAPAVAAMGAGAMLLGARRRRR